MGERGKSSGWGTQHAGARRAVLLTGAFWAFVFLVFQTPAIRTGALKLWEFTAYLVIVALGALTSLAIYLLLRRTQFLSLRTRIALIAAACLVVAIAQSAADHLIFVASSHLFGVAAPLPQLIEAFAFNILIYVWVYGLYATAATLVLTTDRMRDQERRLAHATAAAQEAQLAALRFQINPHFLFNALNAVTSLIGAGRHVEAETVVVRLSEFFRVSLATSPSDLVPLEDELDVIGSYLDIEAARFGERLIVDIEFADELSGALVPHFLLQPLVENAVKHGVARSKTPVTVSVRAEAHGGQLLILVSDDAGGPLTDAPAANGVGVGLANVRARLSTLYGEAGRLRAFTQGRLYCAQIVLPLQIAVPAGAAAA
jgi:sensor histidine kinase YesM